MPAEVNYAELLGWLEGYEDRAYPREVPESVLAKSREAIRALQAENERLTRLALGSPDTDKLRAAIEKASRS